MPLFFLPFSSYQMNCSFRLHKLFTRTKSVLELRICFCLGSWRYFSPKTYKVENTEESVDVVGGFSCVSPRLASGSGCQLMVPNVFQSRTVQIQVLASLRQESSSWRTSWANCVCKHNKSLSCGNLLSIWMFWRQHLYMTTVLTALFLIPRVHISWYVGFLCQFN